MSTTVSYKGQTLTTVSNDTKTLLTEGKYLEDDLTLVDVSGGGSTLITKSISANGTYNASSDSADGYSQVNVAVPNTYTNADEGKVVSDGALVAQTSKNINSNGTHSTVTNNQVVVAVPNSYSAGDEGKVVSNGALVAQTSDTVTTNDTYDTTLINSLTVNVSGGGGDNIEALNNNTLTSYASDNITELKSSIFFNNTNLTSLSIPNATRINGSSLRNTGLTVFVGQKVTRIDDSGVAYNTSLTTVDILGKDSSSLMNGALRNNSNLTTIILRDSNIVANGGTNVLTSTPFRSGGSGGTIYIPKALYDHLGDGTSSDYKAATNWSTIDGYGTITWAKIEGSYYETHYADGTVIS